MTKDRRGQSGWQFSHSGKTKCPTAPVHMRWGRRSSKEPSGVAISKESRTVSCSSTRMTAMVGDSHLSSTIQHLGRRSLTIQPTIQACGTRVQGTDLLITCGLAGLKTDHTVSDTFGWSKQTVTCTVKKPSVGKLSKPS